MTDTKISADATEHVIAVPHSGKLKVFVQGNLEEKHGKTIFLTCHDMGTNYKSWLPFVNHAAMTGVRERSIFIHVCVPGQEDNAETLPESYNFPSLDQMGQDLSTVIDHFNVKSVIGIGEGAGANIIIRFAINNPNRALGIILIHCTASTASMMEYLNNKMISWKGALGMSQGAYDYLVSHKFGPGADAREARVEAYVAGLKARMNSANLSRYLDAYLKRTEIGSLSEKLKVDALLVAGTKTSHVQSVNAMHQNMNKSATTLLMVDDVGDVLTESPYKITRALILFCKGCGALSGVGIPGMERQRTLSGSMEEADRPRKLSLSFNRSAAIEKMPE